jgi:hypothetical protein
MAGSSYVVLQRCLQRLHLRGKHGRHGSGRLRRRHGSHPLAAATMASTAPSTTAAR